VIFPNDENGTVLRRMHENGDTLTEPRNVDFSVAFPNEDVASQFAAQSSWTGCVVTVEKTDCAPGLPWDVTVTKKMIPDHGRITEFECLLQVSAQFFGGRNDGWGCFEVQPDV